MASALIILAAGQGTRMNSDLPKVLHKVAGAPLLVHAMRAGAQLEPEHCIVVAGHGSDLVTAAAKAYDATTKVVLQTEQLGTGHAVAQALPALEGFTGKVIVLYGDTPFIQPGTLSKMLAAKADVVVLGFRSDPSTRYGRLVAEGDSL
ncbi:MAG: NTP transferase domain-containing protein, partial [Albidovulum sp.]